MIKSYDTEVTFLIILATVIMVLIVSENNLLSKYKKRSLVQWYLLLILAAFSEWFGFFLNGKPDGTILLHGVVKALEYSLIPYFCIKLLNVIEPERKNKWLPCLVGIHALFEFSSVFTGLAFYIDENNYFQSGEFNWVHTAMYIFCSVYTLTKCFVYGNHFQSSCKKISAGLVSLLLSGIILRQIKPEVRLELLSITFCAIFMYIYYVDILQRSDPLTGLLNRGSYISKVSDMSGQSAILYFDIDEFKNINDRYGHPYGDQVLKIVGQSIKEVYAKYGSCYRIGGDEFCVILEKKTEDVERFNAEFGQLLELKRKTEPNLPTVSLGYSVFHPEEDKIEDVIYSADVNMYRTKTKLRQALQETNRKLLAMVQAFQIAAEESSTLVFMYDLKEQSILVDERTAKAFGVAEKQEGIPYQTAKMGIVSEDTVEKYIQIHEEMLNGASKATGIIKLIQKDGTQSTQRLSFRAVYDEEGEPTGNAVGIYSIAKEIQEV